MTLGEPRRTQSSLPQPLSVGQFRPTEPCRCGIYSIGRCENCGDAVCGDHGKLYAGALHCQDCARALSEEDQFRKREAAERVESDATAAREKLESSAERAIRRAAEALVNSGRPRERQAAVAREESAYGPARELFARISKWWAQNGARSPRGPADAPGSP